MQIRKSLMAVFSGAVLTAISLLLIAISFPMLFNLIALLAFLAFLISVVSVSAMLPEITKNVLDVLLDSVKRNAAKARNRRKIEKLIKERR